MGSSVLFNLLFAIPEPAPDSFLGDLGSVVFIVVLRCLPWSPHARRRSLLKVHQGWGSGGR
jgi:hypothetical protein